MEEKSFKTTRIMFKMSSCFILRTISNIQKKERERERERESKKKKKKRLTLQTIFSFFFLISHLLSTSSSLPFSLPSSPPYLSDCRTDKWTNDQLSFCSLSPSRFVHKSQKWERKGKKMWNKNLLANDECL